MWESFAISLLVKLAVVAAIASVLARSNAFKSLLMRENRTLGQRLALAVWLAVVFGGGVATRLLRKNSFRIKNGVESRVMGKRCKFSYVQM